MARSICANEHRRAWWGAVVDGLDRVHDRPRDSEAELVDLCLAHHEMAVVEGGEHLVRGVR